jgi:predicted tellurium resistance membrane protein TerC
MFDPLISLAQNSGAWTGLVALIAIKTVLGIDKHS